MFQFKVDDEYFRDELLEFVGSKQGYSGIIYNSKTKEPDCVIITSGGSSGKESGYHDRRHEDGSWDYYGQGSKGDQNAHTSSNSLLTNQRASILLFSTRELNAKEIKEQGNRKKKYKFEGIFSVLSWGTFVPDYGSRKGDSLIVYRLIPASNIFNDFEVESIEPPSKALSLAELALKISAKEKSANKGKKKITVQEYKERSLLVKTYALLRSQGICELCEKPAPFITEKGAPFLEVHHIFRLADDGPDLPENVAALCPNCHREAHFSKNKVGLKDSLFEKILLKG
jgi:5-methylcytosine-specific restriction protein A